VKIKSVYLLYSINILMAVLILIIVFLPNNILRIILGLPFVLFVPGYTLIAALYHRKSDLDGIQRLALSLGLSIAVVPLIGLILNYTWGITTNSILVSITVFVVVMSVIAWFNLRRFPDGEQVVITIPRFSWKERSQLEKILSIILVFVILGAIGVVVYAIAVPKTGERFTEFYVLNSEGEASDYPTKLNLSDTGNVTLGIANREQQDVSYKIETKIDGVPVSTIGPIVLKNDEKYETIATFKPQEVGNHQKVEFLLFKNESLDPYMELHIWVDVK